MSEIQIRRDELRFLPDCSRVLMRSFIPSERSRLTQIIGGALALSEEETGRELEKVRREFSARHRDLDSLLLGIYRRVRGHVLSPPPPLPPPPPLFLAPFFRGDTPHLSPPFQPSLLPPPPPP